MKPFPQTAAPVEHRAPHHRTPVEMTGLWARAIGLLSAAVLFLVLGIVGAVMLEAWQAFGVGVLFALLVGVPGAILALYTLLEHWGAYGKNDKPAKKVKQRVIYTHNEAIPKPGGGYTFQQSKHQGDFTSPVEDVAKGVVWMLRHGSSRDTVEAGYTWGQKEWARNMRELAALGVATKHGRSYKLTGIAYDWASSVLGKIDDLDAAFDDMDKWQ